MLQPNRLFESAYIRKGFKFPSDYLNFLKSYDLEGEDIWWFIGGDDNSNPDFWFRTLTEQYPYRCLIPFAKLDGYDDIACFDGESEDGSPQVFMIHSFASPGWELRGTWPTFSAWYADVKAIFD